MLAQEPEPQAPGPLHWVGAESWKAPSPSPGPPSLHSPGSPHPHPPQEAQLRSDLILLEAETAEAARAGVGACLARRPPPTWVHRS